MNSTIRKQILARAKRNLRLRDRLHIMTDVNVEEYAEVTRDAEGYIVDSDVLSFTVPADTIKEDVKPGTKYDKTFSFRVVENDEQANKIMEEKGLTLLDLINRKLKADARSNAYQSEVLAHKPLSSTVPVADIKERLVRDFMRAGEGRITEAMARAQVEAILSQSNG